MNTGLVRNVVLGSALLVLAAGCSTTGTRAESQPMTETDQVWAQNLQRWYPGWRPPHLAPAPQVETEAVAPVAPPVAAAPAEPVAVETAPAASDTGVDLVPATEVKGKTPHAGAAAKKGGVKHPAAKTYTVKPGDTLEIIAKKCYGKTSAWKHILDSNRRVVSNPKKLKAGMVLKITPLP